jgi:hypothetical protein
MSITNPDETINAQKPEGAVAPQAPEPRIWNFVQAGKSVALTMTEISAYIADGSITGATLAWKDGMSEWAKMSTLPELAALLVPKSAVQAKKVIYKKQKYFPVPMINKGAKAKDLYTDRWVLFAGLVAYTYLFVNEERYKGVVLAIRVRFSSWNRVPNKEILTRYERFLSRTTARRPNERRTDREKIRDAVVAGVQCFEVVWDLPSEGPELDQGFFLPLSLITRHMVRPVGITNLPRRRPDEPDGKQLDRRFVWTEQGLTDDDMGVTVLGSVDLDYPKREEPDDCLLFIPRHPTAGNFVKAVYELVIRSGVIKDITQLFAGLREEVEQLEEVDEYAAAAPPDDETIATRSVGRRTVEDAPLPPARDETDRSAQPREPVTADGKPVEPVKLSVKSGRS